MEKPTIESTVKVINASIDFNKRTHPNMPVMVIDAEFVKDLIKIRFNELKNDIQDLDSLAYLSKYYHGFDGLGFNEDQLEAICHFAECFAKYNNHGDI